MATTGPEKDLAHATGEKVYEEVITTHLNADFDALASMIAAQKLYPEAALVFPGSQEKNLRNFFLHSTSYLFNFTRLKHVDFDRIKRLILVDTRQKAASASSPNLVHETAWRFTSMTTITTLKKTSTVTWK
jgi:nanoRNase/pAp phosphatase (c-di-AMP/oligoRNAs hydrolase)